MPGAFRLLVQRLLDHLKELDRQVDEIEAQIQAWHRNNTASCKLARIPGIGPITASALVASIGDTYLRTLLIHGGRSVIRYAEQKPEACSWINGVVNRRNKNVAAVALANKNARTIWALLFHEFTGRLRRRKRVPVVWPSHFCAWPSTARASSSYKASIRRVTAGSIVIGRPHSRCVSPGHLWVASSPIFEPRPAVGDAKSR